MTPVATLTEDDVVHAPSAPAGPWASGDEVIGRYEVTPSGMRLLEASAERQLAHFGALPAGWDSYGAPPIDRGVIALAGHFLAYLASQNVDGPYVVPTSRGGITFEWYQGPREMTCSFDPGKADPSIFMADDASREEREGPLSSMRSYFGPALLRMTR